MLYEVITDDTQYKRDDLVIVDTARGIEMGTVYLEPRMVDESDLVLPLKPVVRKATKDDIDRYTDLRNQADEAFNVCKKKIFEHKLPMKLITSEYTFDRTKLIFYFTAEGRIRNNFV